MTALEYIGAGALFGLGFMVSISLPIMIQGFFRGVKKGRLSEKQSAEGLQAFKTGLADGKASIGPKTIFQGKKPN